jgi:HD-like signal output (HDOD) protein
MPSQPSSPAEVSNAAILAAAIEIGAMGTGQASLPLLLAALCDPATDAAKVARVVAQEPGLAARVLRVANSAYYGLSGKVSTLERAFVLLGADAVRGIAAAACLDRTATRALVSSPINLREMLRHSVATAAAASALARFGHRSLASEAFIGGLLHDFGVIVQLQVDRPAFERLLAGIGVGPPAPVRELEERFNCVGHERCAAVVFQAWKLPPNLVAAIANHHDPRSAPESNRIAATLLHVANHLSGALGYGFALEPVPSPLPEKAVHALGLDLETIEQVQQALPEQVAALLGQFPD